MDLLFARRAEAGATLFVITHDVGLRSVVRGSSPWRTGASFRTGRRRELAWRLALRDLRRAGSGLMLLALCLFLGTAALGGIGSLSASMLAALDAQGRQMLGGDLELRVSQRRATIEEGAAFAEAGAVSEAITMRAMAEPEMARACADRPEGRGCALAAGRPVRAGAGRAGPAAARGGGGDRAGAGRSAGGEAGRSYRVGATRLRIIGTVAEEPDQLGGGFTLGPRVLVDMATLEATAVLQPGSLYESRYRLALPAGANPRRWASG
jgi:putative ABC transport system permease protein